MILSTCSAHIILILLLSGITHSILSIILLVIIAITPSEDHGDMVTIGTTQDMADIITLSSLSTTMASSTTMEAEISQEVADYLPLL